MNTPIHDVRDLKVWQRAMSLAEAAYRLAALVARRGDPDLARQIRRAAVSVPSNIAEGYARRSSRDYARFLVIAGSSGRELETQALLSERLSLSREAEAAPVLALYSEVAKMLTVLGRAIRKSSRQ